MNFFQRRTQSFTRCLGRIVECIKDFYRPLEDLRIIFLSLLAGGFVLLYLDQGRDVIRGLVNSANAVISNWPPQGDVLPVILRWVAFMLACVWSGINAWYWANLMYKTSKGNQQQPRWFRFVRRGFGILPLLAAFFAMPLSARHGIWDTWFGMLCFAIAAGLLLWFFIYRTTWFTEAKVPKAYKEVDPEHNLVQGDRWFIRATIAISFAILLIAANSPVAHQLCLDRRARRACIRRYRLHHSDHQLHDLEDAQSEDPSHPAGRPGVCGVQPLQRQSSGSRCRCPDQDGQPTDGRGCAATLGKGRSDSEPLVLVATAGGASRAAYWTGTVLRALDDRSKGQFSDHVFAISSVSGGALGAIGYAAWLADRPMDSEAQPTAAQARLNFVQDFFGQDYLGPSVGALLFPDLIQRFLPLPLLPDRAASLEEAFELGWQQSAEECKQQPCPKPTRFADEYTRIWSKSRLHEGGDRWVPIVLANGTHVETGKRIITAPVQIDTSVFEDTYDFYRLAPAPIRASTAVLNSARFTVVSPPGRLVRDGVTTGRIIDGGYFENGGMETVYDLARYLRRAMQPARPIIIVEILNDDTLSDEDLKRHSENAAVPIEPAKSEGRSPLLLEVTSIIGGLYHTRSARGVLGAKRISDAAASGLSDTKFYSFDLRPLNNNWHTAMSWALSLGTRDAIDVALNTTKEQINDFLKSRNYALEMRRSLTADLLDGCRQLKENNKQLDAVLDALIANVKCAGRRTSHRRQAEIAAAKSYTFHQAFEPAIDHPLAVERRRLPVHHRFEPRIRHHLGVDPVALGARLVGDPGEHHGLARLQLDAARERGELADLDVVGDPFAVIQRAVFAPDLAALLRKAAYRLRAFSSARRR